MISWSLIKMKLPLSIVHSTDCTPGSAGITQLDVSSQDPIGTLHLHSSPSLQLHCDGVPLKLSEVFLAFSLAILLTNENSDETWLRDWSLQTVWHCSILRFRFFIFFFKDLLFEPRFFLFFFMSSGPEDTFRFPLSFRFSSFLSSSKLSSANSCFELRSNFKIVFTWNGYRVV